MKKFKRFKQSYRVTINSVVWEHKKSNPGWPNGRISYAINLGEMFEWANACYFTRWLWKETVK